MKKVLTALLLVAPLSVGVGHTAGVAQAQVDTDVSVEVTANGNSGTDRSEEAASTENTDRSKSDDNGKPMSASTTSKARGQLTAEAQRSVTASFVQSLLSAADRDTGIGTEVRAVAQSQQESASTTAEAVAKVEGRSEIMVFLFGTDWKNLGAVRSEVAKTGADIEKLRAALSKTTSSSVRADLEVQINVLEDQQENLANFVAEHESSFSLFGWFTKLFVNAEA